MYRNQNHSSFNNKTIIFIKELHNLLPSSKKPELLKALNFSENQLEEFFLGNHEISNIQFFQLASTNFSIQGFAEDKIDINALTRHIMGDEAHVPKKYQTSFGAKNFFLKISLEFIEQRLGKSYSDATKNYLQLSEKSNSGELSQRVLDDINIYLDKLGFTEEDYFDLGYFATNRLLFSKIKDTRIAKLEFPQLLKWFLENVMPSSLENINDYKVTKIEPGHFEFTLSTNPGAMNCFIPKKSGNINQCPKRLGGIKAVLDFKQISGKTAHPQCRYKGDEKCLFAIKY